MKNFFPLLFALIYLCSCEPGNQIQAQDISQQLLEEIALDETYYQYQKAFYEYAKIVEEPEFDGIAFIEYMEKNHLQDSDYCQLDLSDAPVPGIKRYTDSLCRLNESMNQLSDKFSEYDQLSDAQHDQLRDIFQKHYGRPFAPDPKPEFDN